MLALSNDEIGVLLEVYFNRKPYFIKEVLKKNYNQYYCVYDNLVSKNLLHVDGIENETPVHLLVRFSLTFSGLWRVYGYVHAK